jgi:hypothetical protein
MDQVLRQNQRIALPLLDGSLATFLIQASADAPWIRIDKSADVILMPENWKPHSSNSQRYTRHDGNVAAFGDAGSQCVDLACGLR